MSKLEMVRRYFPTDLWHPMKATQKAVDVRYLLIAGFFGKFATDVARFVDCVIGKCPYGDTEFTVSIPFQTRDGVEVTLFGGHIHAGTGITWDVLYNGQDYDDVRFPYGLSCMKTVELVRAIRSL